MAYRMILAVAISLTAIVVAASARAQDDQFLVLGMANQSCGNYVSAVEAEKRAKPRSAKPNVIYTTDYLAFYAFTDGFLSGANLRDVSHREVG